MKPTEIFIGSKSTGIPCKSIRTQCKFRCKPCMCDTPLPVPHMQGFSRTFYTG